MDDPQFDRRGAGTGQRHLLVAQCHLGDARRPAVLAGLFAGLRPRAQPLHLDLGVAAGRRVAHLVEQMARDRLPVGRLLLAEDTVDLRADQQVDLRGVRAAREEQVEEVGLAVHRAHHAGFGQLLGRLRAIAQPLDPTERLPLLARLRGRLAFRRGVRGRGRVEGGPQHAQRHPVGIDGQRRVQLQTAGHGAGLVRADGPQPLRPAAPGEVQAGAVLDAQHRVVRLHPAQRALAMRREDVVDRHRAVGGLVDQPVVALDHRARAVGGAGDGAHRRLCHLLRALHQAGAQPRVAQPRPAELVVRPDLGVETVANRQRRHDRCGRREACAPRRLQRIHIHRLARFRRRVRAILATATAGLTHPNPVGRAHARPRLFGLVDERLQQPGAITIPTLAVVADRPDDPAQHVRGQVAARNAGAHQQPAQSQHPVQVGAPARVVPPDPGVAGPQPPRRCREPHAAQPAMRRTHQIPQLRADERTGAARVLVRHQRVPDPALLAGLHQHQGQTPNLVDRARHVHCRRHRMREHPRPAPTAASGLTRRQRDVACRLQVGQRPAAARALPPAPPIAEIERFTDAVGDLPEAADALRHRPVQHVAQAGEVAP